jgi:hypothetical protein
MDRAVLAASVTLGGKVYLKARSRAAKVVSSPMPTWLTAR